MLMAKVDPRDSPILGGHKLGGLVFWGLDMHFGAWTSKLGHGTDCRELWLRCWGLAQTVESFAQAFRGLAQTSEL